MPEPSQSHTPQSRWSEQPALAEAGIRLFSGVSGSPDTLGQPFVLYQWGAQETRFTPEEARQHAMALLIVAESAVQDAALFQFLQQRVRTPPEAAGQVVADLRHHRADLTTQEALVLDAAEARYRATLADREAQGRAAEAGVPPPTPFFWGERERQAMQADDKGGPHSA